ncbi:MAG TPA: 30S ribosome-binding factor RbfA [Acidimicrobiales bacterium]|nr:30S ribosome-binding factor RbfA [Acidimicrobiales bacterium]
MARRRRQRRPVPGEVARYPRVARVNELCREIVAEELERIDDERLELVTITHVAVDADLRRAIVEFSRLGEAEDVAAEALAEHRVRLQSAIARQARLRRTPELSFRIDQAIRAGARIEELLRQHPSQRERPDD